MDFASAFMTALRLIFDFDPDVVSAVKASVVVSSWATLFAAIVGVPLGVLIAANEFRLKRACIVTLNTLMAMPTVVIGLVVYGLISRNGIFGGFGLLFTPWAIVVGGAALAVPIIANLTLAAVKGADVRILPTAFTLGASRMQGMLQLAREVRFGIMAAVIAGFGRVISEVGVAMMLGGNIRGYTRTMTTAIALETSKGEFALGLALGIVLMAVALLINVLLHSFQQGSHA